MTVAPGHNGGGSRRRRRALGRAGAGAVAFVAAFVALASPASADFGIESFTTSASSHDAGAHADVSTTFKFPDEGLTGPGGGLAADGHAARIEVDLPRGLVGDPTGIPRCSRDAFRAGSCPAAAQVGEADLWLHSSLPGDVEDRPVYNLQPSVNEPALLGIDVQGVLRAYIRLTVRADGGLRAVIDDLPFGAAIIRSDLTLWGVPADNNRSGAPRVPFMTNPTNCTDAPVTVLRAWSYEDRDTVHTATAASPVPEHCEDLPFNPSMTVQPTTRVAGAATGLNVDLLVPQNEDPDGRATAHLRDVIVNMPEGLSINPGTARDLSACQDSAFARNSTAPAQCPPGSKIGTVGIATPLLDDPLPGDIYMGEPRPGERFRLFLYAAGNGVRIKLIGDVIPDPQTGRIAAVFRDNPQLPFTRMSLRFRGGNNAAMAMPPTCGTKTGHTGFSSWAGKGGSSSHFFLVFADEVGTPCPETQPFGPSFVAGTTIPGAGGDTGLTLAFSRADQEQYLGGLRMQLPHGLLGRLAAIPQCPVAKVNANECSEESLVGGVTVSAGAGDALLHLPGRIYLTEPFAEGQIAGMAIVVRAVAGPYDLGTVVVRTGIKVNPDTSLSIETEPMPTMLEGIPLRIRQVAVNVDRPGFMFNPTDCSPKRIMGTVLSSTGTEAGVGSPFQVRGCGDLPFAPPMTITATAPSKSGTMGLEVNLGGLGGHANARQVQVVLPSGMGARLEGPLQSACKEAQFATDTCPAASRVGTSEAVTPILPTPLAGDVYFLENPDGTLPKLAVRLKGLVQLDLVADIVISRDGRIVNTFSAVPDVPITNFRLKLDSGDQAILAGSKMCGRRLTATRNMIGHNGQATTDTVPVTVSGCRATAGSKAKAKGGEKGRKKGKRKSDRRGARS